MNLLESLKEARRFLSKSEGDEKNSPICYAITDAFKSRYGFTDIANCYDLKVKAQLSQARDFIAEKLAELQREHRLREACFFTKQCAAVILGFRWSEKVSFEQRQTARHLWLDSLIDELSNDRKSD